MAAVVQAAIELYYWPTPNGWKASIMLEECGLPYTVHPVNIGKGDQFKPEFLRLAPTTSPPRLAHPAPPGTAPTAGPESGASLQCPGRKPGRLGPSDEGRRVAVEEWLFCKMGGFGP